MSVLRKFRTPKARKRERMRMAGVGMLTCLVLGFSLYGMHWLLSRPHVRIQNFQVQGAGSTPIKLIEESVRSALAGAYFGVVPKDNTLVVRPEHLRVLLLERFPRLKEATVRRSAPDTLSVQVLEREPVALWCGDIVPAVASRNNNQNDGTREEEWGACYLMDNDSYIFAQAPVYTGDVFPRYYGPLAHAEPIGQYFITATEFAQLRALYEALRGASLAPEALLIVDEQEIEFYIGSGTRVLALRDTPSETIVRTLGAAKGAPDIKSDKELEYIDLRFPGKAYYRYHGEQSGGEE